MTGRHAAPAQSAQTLSELDDALHELLKQCSYVTPEGVVLTPEVSLVSNDEGTVGSFDISVVAEFSNEHGTWPGPTRSLSLGAVSTEGQKLNSVDLFLTDQDGNLAGGASFGFPHQGNAKA